MTTVAKVGQLEYVLVGFLIWSQSLGQKDIGIIQVWMTMVAKLGQLTHVLVYRIWSAIQLHSWANWFACNCSIQKIAITMCIGHSVSHYRMHRNTHLKFHCLYQPNHLNDVTYCCALTVHTFNHCYKRAYPTLYSQYVLYVIEKYSHDY